jgi:hypothetical protein
MARTRASAMLSPQADAEQVAFVAQVMAGIDPAGYTQAAHMLSGGDLAGRPGRVRCPMQVASGSADTITPATGCQALARRPPVAGWTDLRRGRPQLPAGSRHMASEPPHRHRHPRSHAMNDSAWRRPLRGARAAARHAVAGPVLARRARAHGRRVVAPARPPARLGVPAAADAGADGVCRACGRHRQLQARHRRIAPGLRIPRLDGADRIRPPDHRRPVQPPPACRRIWWCATVARWCSWPRPPGAR